MALTGNDARELSRSLIDTYFRTVSYPYTRHHIDSYDQFMQQDMISIIRSQNPIYILKELLPGTNENNLYKYQVQIFVGGEDGMAIEIGTPTVSLQNAQEVRVLYPNEARLRNLSYSSSVYATIFVKIIYTPSIGGESVTFTETFSNWQLFKIPIMLHSRYCILHNKPREFLREAGECPYDNGGYFVVDGAEKVLVTRQEQAFNTLYVTPQNDPKVAVFASISCLSATTRQVKRIAFALTREVDKEKGSAYATIQVSLPFVRRPIPLFVLFRALGFQSDEEILKLIFPDFQDSEAKLLLPKLHASILDGFPFLNSYTAVEYIKTLTKGFSIAHVLDIIKNQLFIHIPNDATTQALFLGDCVRKILRVNEGYDSKTDRDDTRNQRCLTSGFLIQELFNNCYKSWIKIITLEIDKEYNYNKAQLYKDENFKNIFMEQNGSKIFAAGKLTQMIMKGFKGKWGTGLGEDKSGVLQALSRLSYVDFMSQCRRVILDFDTSMKLTGPRKLHPSQYGYFCTSETPTGASIGITKNLSIMTTLSTSSKSEGFIAWLKKRGGVFTAEQVTLQERILFVPVYLNGGTLGYVEDPYMLTDVLKMFKRAGCLPYSVSISFSVRDRRVYLYMDAGRPLRPLVWLDKTKSMEARVPVAKIRSLPTWRHMVMGVLKLREKAGLETTDFLDPLQDREGVELKDYIDALKDNTGVIEYIDPYEQNESFIANNPAYLTPETTHMEVHPSTIMSMMTSLIPFAPHNQSPRNQLSCSQSKQGLSIYATNWRNRFDNTAHVLCYGEMPLTRTLYNNYLGEGKMAYGMNCVLAIACWSGYNQEDGIVMNYDAVRRGMFRSMAFRSYQAYEEDDEKAGTKVRFGNPAQITVWKDLKPGLDYSKLDERGIIREGEYVDENTVIVGAYLMSTTGGNVRDASTTPQVWTRGRVEKVVIMVNNVGLRLVKVRVVQDRIPELGDKFSNRHGQKGTIGALLRGHDMPRTESGIVPDMIMNPHAIPSRMTIAQNLEQLLGKTAGLTGCIGDGTSFMNDGSPQEDIGGILELLGFEKYGNEVMYNGATGEQINAAIFIGPVYGMRLKHMVEDKWQARGQGRKEVRTHQPTGGRGAQGGLKIGEMDRDAIVAHAGMAFVKESFMERSDGATMPICVACGTIPIYNPRLNLAVCSMCDGPLQYIGTTVNDLELLPPLGRPKSKIVQIQMPYSMKLLTQEQEAYLNLSMRYITTSGVERLKPIEFTGAPSGEPPKPLQAMVYPETRVPAYVEQPKELPMSDEELRSLQAQLGEMSAQEKAQSEQIQEELVSLVPASGMAPAMGPSMGPSIGEAMGQEPMMASEMGESMGPSVGSMMGQPQMMGPSMGPSMAPSMVQEQIPIQQVPMSQVSQVPSPQQGGLPLPTNTVIYPPTMDDTEMYDSGTGSGPFIAVRTDEEAMAADGLLSGFSRPPRRAPYRNMGGMMPSPMQPAMPRYTPAAPAGATDTIRVTKLE
jgi:DNA-directed RNA polymerase II subunit RPB2